MDNNLLLFSGNIITEMTFLNVGNIYLMAMKRRHLPHFIKEKQGKKEAIKGGGNLAHSKTHFDDPKYLEWAKSDQYSSFSC